MRHCDKAILGCDNALLESNDNNAATHLVFCDTVMKRCIAKITFVPVLEMR